MPHLYLTCLSAGLSRRLLRLLSDCGPAPSIVEDKQVSDCGPAPSGVEDRQVSERLWVLFLSALEHFLSDLRKAYDLIGRFPLTQRNDRRSLVNTGQLMLLLPVCRSCVTHLMLLLPVCRSCVTHLMLLLPVCRSCDSPDASTSCL